MKTHEVRFHLQSGKNFSKWQVKIMEGRKKVSVRYYDPQEVQLELLGCRLVNKIGKAKKVHKAQKKDVSGWILCKEVVLSQNPTEGLEKLFYNPILDVHWRREGDEGEFQWDETEYCTLVTQGRQVYILEERT
jgi:hypothetical protein